MIAGFIPNSGDFSARARLRSWRVDTSASSSATTSCTAGDSHSLCLCSDGSYGVSAGLISSFPTRSDGKTLEIVQGLPINDYSRSKIDASVNELNEERTLVSELLPS